MRNLKFLGLGLMLVANFAVAGALPPIPLYQESPDAGGISNPQDVTGGPWAGIKGDIGGTDKEDAFRFTFAGGTFSGSFVFAGTDGVLLTLYTDSLDVRLTDSQIQGGSESIDPGVYILEFLTDSVDPQFFFTLTGPSVDVAGNCIDCPITAAPTAAPEPGMLALMLAGLAGMGALRRRSATAA